MASEGFKADVSSSAGAKVASSGAAVVYHAAQPEYTKWTQEFPAMTEAIVDGRGLRGREARLRGQPVHVRSWKTQPMTEETPQRAEGKKGRVRIQMAEKLLEAQRVGQVRVAIGRASDYYGPGGTGTIAGDTVFDAVLAGKTVRWPGSLDTSHQFNYLPDLARALVTLGERDEADGEVWHLPAAEPITGRHFLDLVSAEVGRPVKASATPRSMMRAIGLVLAVHPRTGRDRVPVRGTPSTRTPRSTNRPSDPFDPTPHDEAIGHTTTWFRKRQGP